MCIVHPVGHIAGLRYRISSLLWPLYGVCGSSAVTCFHVNKEGRHGLEVWLIAGLASLLARRARTSSKGLTSSGNVPAHFGFESDRFACPLITILLLSSYGAVG